MESGKFHLKFVKIIFKMVMKWNYNFLIFLKLNSELKFLSFFYCHPLEPRKEKTDSSNGSNNNNALSPQEQLANHQQQHMNDRGGGGDGQQINKPERPNSLGPKLSKRINFYHSDNCKHQMTWFIFYITHWIVFIIIQTDHDNQKKGPESPLQSSNSIISNNQNNNQQHQQQQQQQLYQQLQQHHAQQQQQQMASSGGGYLSNGIMSGTGMGGSGNIVGNIGNIMLSELPEPPIPVSEIGPIPPPPMFSTPSPTMIAGRPHGPAVSMMGHRELNDYDYDGKLLCFIIISMDI